MTDDAPQDPTDPDPAGGPVHGRLLLPAFQAAARQGVLRQVVRHWPVTVQPADVRDAFVSELLHSHGSSWQEVWDRWADAHRGRVPVRVRRCERCNGRRVDPRTATVCRTCAGTAQHLHDEHVAVVHAPR